MRLDWSLSANQVMNHCQSCGGGFVSQIDPNLEELADVKTAVSEAVTNAIIHGYENEPGFVKMTLKLYEDAVEISVTDEGKA